MKRIFPKDLADKLTPEEQTFSKFENLISKEWLSKDTGTELHKLWNDPSLFATLELYIFDQSLRSIPNLPPSWVKDWRRNIQNNPERRYTAGYLSELVLAGIFASGGHRIEFGRTNEPAYEFTLPQKSVKPLRVSCKYVGSKDSEVSFVQAMEDIRISLKEQILQSAPSMIMVEALNKNFKGMKDGLLNMLIQSVRQNRPDLGGILAFNEADYQGWVGPLGSLIPHPFDATHKSYSFTAIHPIHPNEQKKFEDTVEKASDDMNSAFDRGSYHNFLAIFLNQSIDFSKAKLWIEEQFLQGKIQGIDLVLLVRMQPTSEQKDSDSLALQYIVTTEFDLIRRSTAFDYFDAPPHLVAPIGKISRVPTVTQLKIGNGIIDLSKHYHYFFGEHYYLVNHNQEINLFTLPNLHIHAVTEIRPGEKISFKPKNLSRLNFYIL